MKNNNIGKTIKILRKRANLTQNELAAKMFITDKAVSKWERGLSYPDASCINRLSKVLDVDSDALFIEEDKHMSSSWGGILYVPTCKNNISLKTKISNKTIFSLMICYFLLVNITSILIICDNRDIGFLERECKIFDSSNVKIFFTENKQFDIVSINDIFVKESNIMLIHDLFFIYGVGLTSTFQRAMMDATKPMYLDNPKIPIVFGKNKYIYNMIKNDSFSDVDKVYKMFRGFIKIDLNSRSNIRICSELVRIIENLGKQDIYNPIEIVKKRNI